jgi:Fic-DOC domain mobile mystery protein B
MSAGPASPAETPLTPSESERLVPSLSTRGELREIERLGIHAARVWAMRPATLARSDLLSVEFVRELHRRMFGGIWRRAGRFRTAEEGAGWECGRVAQGVGLFLDDAEGWLRYSTYPVHEAAVRLHHRLVSVRPWANGNGRHARLMADVVVAAQGEAPLTWGARVPGPGSPSQRYFEAIAAADGGDLDPLVGFARS